MKIFKRPMFRKGGEVGGGIMTGITRENYQDGTTKERLAKVMAQYPSSAIDPLSQFLIQGGLNLVSGPATGGGALADVATAFKEPTAGLFQGLAQKGQMERELALQGEMLDIEQEQAMKLAKLKQRSESGMQKDYSPQRAYEDLVKTRTESRSELTSFQKPNVEQAFPRQTAEYDTYILRNLRATDNTLGQEINANNLGILPFDPKTGEFNFENLVTGAYYFYPPRKVFVTKEPATEENPTGLFQIDPYSFQKSPIK
jgi:hypothetical protein